MRIQNENELVEACKNQDRSAMEKIYLFHMPRMLAVSRRYCKNQWDAEDVVQDAFIKVFRNFHGYKHDKSLSKWIERIVINCAIDHWHVSKKTLYTESHELLEHISNKELEDTEDRHLIEQVSIDKLRDLISELPDQYRFVLNLYAIEGYSHKQIGEMLGIKESTSRSNYARARKKLLDTIKITDSLAR